MPSLFSGRPNRVETVTPPAEARSVEARVQEVDGRLLAIALIPRPERGEGLEWQTDRLLDLRNAIRPARPRPVPVIPGGAS